MPAKKNDEFYMQQALKEAEYAGAAEEVPVGAVVVYKKQIIARGSNQIEKLKDPTAHAEMLAITKAAAYLKSKWLNGCKFYVTIEPCSMCAGALVLARIDKLIFGPPDPKTGAFGSKIDINSLGLNHRIEVKGGILAKDCTAVMQNFFSGKRRAKTA